MEMAHAVVLAKRAEAGEAALNARDRAHLARFHGIDASGCALLHPHGPAATGPDLPAGPGEAMAALVGRLGARGLPVLALDLTRAGMGVPVIRMVCPGLDVEPSHHRGARLAALLATTGDGDCQAREIALL